METIARKQEKHFEFTRKINTLLLISHICLFGLFAYLQVTIMVYVNVGSMLLYLSMFWQYKKSIVRYVFIAYVEVLIHMVMATICVGWDGGFQLYTFCLIPCVFLCDYLSRTDGGKSMHPIGTSIVIIVSFLVTRRFCVVNEAIYTLDSAWEYNALFAYNGVLSFAFLVIYMWVFQNRILVKESQLESMAELDELTKLPNRYLLHEWLNGNGNEKDYKKKIAVAILDIDDFKTLNDTYGHECGDQVLREIADIIRRISSSTLKVCRWGGEEFVFLGIGEDAYEQMHIALERVRDQIENKPISFQNRTIYVTVTIGIARYSGEDRNFQDILKTADERLYQGKDKGKNCIIGEEGAE